MTGIVIELENILTVWEIGKLEVEVKNRLKRIRASAIESKKYIIFFCAIGFCILATFVSLFVFVLRMNSEIASVYML